MILLYILFVAIQVLLALFIVFLCIAFITGGPFVPSTKSTVAGMIRAAGIKKGMTVIDVGSGDGRILFAAATQGARAIGIEINPYLVAFSRIRALMSPYRNLIRVRWSDFWKSDLSEADVIFIYLVPWRMKEMASKLRNELKPGSRVVTNSFVFPDWPYKQNKTNHVFIYTV